MKHLIEVYIEYFEDVRFRYTTFNEEDGVYEVVDNIADASQISAYGVDVDGLEKWLADFSLTLRPCIKNYVENNIQL